MNFRTALTRSAVFAILIFGINGLARAQNDSIYRLPAGTRIKLKMDVQLSSRVASVNDTFTTAVASPVMIRDTVVLPVGTVIEGRVVSVSPAAVGGHSGKLDVMFETLRLANDQSREIDGVLVDKFHAGPQGLFGLLSIAAGTGAGAILGTLTHRSSGILIGAGVGAGVGTGIAFSRKGKDVIVPGAAEFEIELKKDVVLPVLDY